MTNTLAIAAFTVFALMILLWLHRVRVRRVDAGLTGKAFEHVAAGRLTSSEAADRLIGADGGCDGCIVTLRTGRQMPLEQHDCGTEKNA